MSTFDLTESFVSLIGLQDEQNPKLGLLKDLKKVNVAFTGFAESQGLAPDSISVLHVCLDQADLHPALLRHINSLDKTEAYKGQNISRFKKLVRHLPWPEQPSDADNVPPILIEEQLPPHLQQVWFLLTRTPSGRSNARRSPAEYSSNGEEYQTMPLTPRGISLGLALLRVSKAHNITDIRTLLEDYSEHIRKDIRLHYPSSSRTPLFPAFGNFRIAVRKFLNYQIEKTQPAAIALDALPEPLRTQMLTFKDRAEHGFKSDRMLKREAISKYGLELDLLSPAHIANCQNIICLGVGRIPRNMYGDSLDLKDLMTLRNREQEIDGAMVAELYNPMVDFYREHEMNRESMYKEIDYDSRAFGMFLEALTTLAAYNGFFKLRKKFKETYKAHPDRKTLKNRKRHKKQVFDRKWLNRQISKLKPRFHCIVNDGSFRSKPDGRLTNEARNNLNLCIFYVALLMLRFLGVRQQCVRGCVMGKNVIFGDCQCVTFIWKEEETKNEKGLIHRLSMLQHDGVLKDLIDAVWTYHKKIYPYISGEGRSSESLALKERRRQAICGQFIVKIRRNGLALPFANAREFSIWFSRLSLKHLDFEGRLDVINIPPSPHFYRAMFGDWLRHDKKCSRDEAAAMAGDSEETFEKEYVDHPTTYDATDMWTKLSQEAKNERDREPEN